MEKKAFKSFFTKPVWRVSLLVLSMVVLAACQSAAAVNQAPTLASVPTAMVAASATPAASTVSEPTISVATDAKLGKILVGDKGMTLYMYTKDEPDKSNCNAGCLKNWPH